MDGSIRGGRIGIGLIWSRLDQFHDKGVAPPGDEALTLSFNCRRDHTSIFFAINFLYQGFDLTRIFSATRRFHGAAFCSDVTATSRSGFVTRKICEGTSFRRLAEIALCQVHSWPTVVVRSNSDCDAAHVDFFRRLKGNHIESGGRAAEHSPAVTKSRPGELAWPTFS